jgi:hypothetical protein
MRKEREGWTYPAYRLRPDRALAAKYLEAQGEAADLAAVPLTYMIFLRGEAQGVDLFKDLDIPRDKALHGGQRYEWHAPIGWDDALDVTATVERITEKTGKNGTLWFADVAYEYRRARDGALALRELTRIIKRS